MARPLLLAALALTCIAGPAQALDRPDTLFKVFQFPADKIPRIDGDDSDWAMVPDDYAVGTDKLAADNGSGRKPDPASIDVKVKVAWVKGLNRLYFLYEATDDYWDFNIPGVKGDIFEIAVDGDRSGGPFIARFNPDVTPVPPKPSVPGTSAPAPVAPPAPPPSYGYMSPRDAWFDFQGHQAQNYHIFTPAGDKDWAMAWGPQAAWIKRLPYSNIAYHYDFKPGGKGKLVMEFWITPFDYASADGPQKSVESNLTENKIIGLAWAIIDSDGPNGKRGFWNLSPKHTMYGQASELCAFKLMPLEAKYQKAIAADWSFKLVDIDRRIVSFKDESTGATSWKWDFGDGETSTEQNPMHTYSVPGQFVVTLEVSGPNGTAKREKDWDVSFEDRSK
jgi:hypothetical protein